MEEDDSRTYVDPGRAQDAQENLIDDSTVLRLADTFKALSDPTRVRLITALHDGEHCVHELVDVVGPSQSAVSHQLRMLRDMRLVRYRKEGRHVYYTLDDDHVEQLLKMGLEHVAEEETS